MATQQSLEGNPLCKQEIQKSTERRLFDIEDVFKTNNMLSRLLRGIVVFEKITMDELEDAIRSLLIRTGRPSKCYHSDKENMVAAISRTAVSFNKTQEFLCTMLGYKMNISITLSKEGETPRVYDYEKVCNEIRQKMAEELQS